jgi:hypothetical protein
VLIGPVVWHVHHVRVKALRRYLDVGPVCPLLVARFIEILNQICLKAGHDRSQPVLEIDEFFWPHLDAFSFHRISSDDLGPWQIMD